MKNKILIGLVIVLGLIVILQGYYIAWMNGRHMARLSYRHNAPFVPSERRLPFNSKFEQGEIQNPYLNLAKEQMRMRKQLDQMMRINQMQQQENIPLFKKIDISEPRVNLVDNGMEYLATMDLPGIDKDKIKVEAQGRVLVISGEIKSENKQDKQGISIKEVSYGNFLRTITLPEDCLTKGITSEYNNGVLKVKIPKQQLKQKPAEKINVPVK